MEVLIAFYSQTQATQLIHLLRLSHVTTDFDKKLSHVHRSSGTTKAIDGVGPDTGLDTMAEVRKMAGCGKNWVNWWPKGDQNLI